MLRLIAAILMLATAGCAVSTHPLHPQAGVVASASTPRVAKVATRSATAHPSAAQSASAASEAVRQRGIGSWYGPRFHGRPTASGERFDKYALTAAHRSLPFGSEVEVKDIRTGKKVRVRINDRGPYSHNRVIDLSYAAANRLDIVRRGTADVELRLVDVDDVEWPDGMFALQVASFGSKTEAEKFLDGMSPAQRATSLYYVKAPDRRGRAWRVRFGPFPCENTAKNAGERLRRAGLPWSLQREQLSGGEVLADASHDAVIR